MAHSFLNFFMITQFAGSIQFQSKIDWNLQKNFYLIRRITIKISFKLNTCMLGRFLLQLQMKTSLEVMNMNATYFVKSQHSHCWFLKKRNAIVIRRSILSITHKLIGRIFIKIHKIHSNIFKWIQNKSSSASREM